MATDSTKIYFSDVFGISPDVLEKYGAFDVSLINDLPMFVDPFLLFNSSTSTYQGLHTKIINYLKFLRDKAAEGHLNDGLLEAWFTFREVKQNWFGYSLEGNQGHGLGMDFARALHSSLGTLFSSFGTETVTRDSHLEKLCLIDDGVGRDNISDFATNLIKGFLAQYTETFSKMYLQPFQRKIVAVPKVDFNYRTQTWESKKYELPFVNGDYVLLTPVDILTKDDVWINKEDIVQKYESVVQAISNEQLRAQLNNYFAGALDRIQKRDEEKNQRKSLPTKTKRKINRKKRIKEPSKRQRSEAVAEAIQKFPEYMDHYIRWKEDHGDEAKQQADVRVKASEELYIEQVRNLVAELSAHTKFYATTGSTYTEVHERVAFLKDVIENKGGWRIFWVDGVAIHREQDLQIMFRLTWRNTPSDVNREVNNGRGPSDFEVSRGRFDKSLIEFKLANNSALEKNLRYQAEAYQKASDAQHALKVIIFFSEADQMKADAALRASGLNGHRDVVLIDARNDNKPSASKIDEDSQ